MVNTFPFLLARIVIPHVSHVMEELQLIVYHVTQVEIYMPVHVILPVLPINTLTQQLEPVYLVILFVKPVMDQLLTNAQAVLPQLSLMEPVNVLLDNMLPL